MFNLILGNISGRHQGFIHMVLENEIWLMFNQTFHHNCHQQVYDVAFFNDRLSFMKQHETVEIFLKNDLSEAFLFPKCPLNYQPSKLEILKETESGSTSRIKKKNKKNRLPRPKVIQNIEWYHKNMNCEQKCAVINILKGEGRPMPYIIYGPPGTGKTMTLIESIIQIHKLFPKNK